MGLTREQEIKALRWLLDRKDREEWPHCYETWRELATLTGADYEAVAVWDLHGDRWIHVVPGRSGLFPIERAEKRLAELTGNQPCRCGQPSMMDSTQDCLGELTTEPPARLTSQQEIAALKWLLDRKDQKVWPPHWETWEALATYVGVDRTAIADWDLHGRDALSVVPGSDGNFEGMVKRAQQRLATLERRWTKRCACGQLAMMDSVLCADCRTVDEAVTIEGTPQPIQPPRPYDGITDWMHPNMSTVGERWRD